MDHVVEHDPRVEIPVDGTDSTFPVRRVYCVGRNYAAHAREMGFDPEREPPFFFCKPADAVVFAPAGAGVAIAYPPQSSNYQYEVELVVAIGTAGRDIAVERADDHVYGYAVGLDMTRRDLQIKSRDMGRPWELGKAFDQSAPIGPITPAARIGHPNLDTAAAIWLQIDGADRQRSTLDNMIWSVPEIIANLSTFFELRPGDLVYTGTPEGVGQVERGQTMRGGVEGLGELEVKVL